MGSRIRLVKSLSLTRSSSPGSNIFSVLLHAQKFEVKDLEDQCWEVIKTKAMEAVNSDEFVTLERSLVETVVKMEKLCIKEVELFKTVDRWATKEIESRGLTPGSNTKRQVLGEDIVKAIRFPLMSRKEFASIVPNCNILTMKEVGIMTKYFNSVLTTPMSFTKLSRFGPKQKCFRFEKVSEPFSFGKNFQVSKVFSSITVSTSKSIFLQGVKLFGRERGSYTADVNVTEDVECSSSLVRQCGTYLSKKEKSHRGIIFLMCSLMNQFVWKKEKDTRLHHLFLAHQHGVDHVRKLLLSVMAFLLLFIVFAIRYLFWYLPCRVLVLKSDVTFCSRYFLHENTCQKCLFITFM